MNKGKKTGKYEKQPTPLQKALSVIGAILCVIFGFMLICNLTIIIKGAIDPDAPPSVLGVTPLVVMSGSMSGEAEDHIEAGDLIFIDEISTDELKTNDIIAFREGEMIVTHRIVGIETDTEGNRVFTTKGDANNVADHNTVSADNVLGIYKTRLPKVGSFVMYLQTPFGMFLFIGVPLLAFVIYDCIRRQKLAVKGKQKEAELESEIRRLRALADEKENSTKE